LSQKVELPSEERLAEAIAEVTSLAIEHGVRPTVASLARSVGLTNSTFWRHYPAQARAIAAAGRTHVQDALESNRVARPAASVDRVAALSAKNLRLKEHLSYATANIARLTLENHRLRLELESLAGVSHLPRRPAG
jgi:AcrR family transcriptional regulator